MALAHERNQTVIEKPEKLEILQPYMKHGDTNKPNIFKPLTHISSTDNSKAQLFY